MGQNVFLWSCPVSFDRDSLVGCFVKIEIWPELGWADAGTETFGQTRHGTFLQLKLLMTIMDLTIPNIKSIISKFIWLLNFMQQLKNLIQT